MTQTLARERAGGALSLGGALTALSKTLLAPLAPRSEGAPFSSDDTDLALANAVLEGARPGQGHAARSAEHLARATEALATATASPALFGGFTGLAWVHEHRRNFTQADADGVNEEIDAALLDLVKPRPWRATYDLIDGLVGYGVYALERLPRPSAARLLETIVAHLAETAEPQRTGLAWRTCPSWWATDDRHALSYGINLGVAHGVPGVIALLGRIVDAGVATREASALLDQAVAWLLGQELPPSAAAAFAYNVRRGAPSEPARAAWCYGDPGIAAALYVAAGAAREPAWRRAAIRIGARAAERDPESCGVVEAGLCHGAAGLAHVFHRLHVATTDERFASAAYAWLRRALAMKVPAGDGLLTGKAGLALALAGFAAPKGARWASWDRLLLLSSAPPAARA
jgi:hypothetical protein